MDDETIDSGRRRIVSLDDPAAVTWWVAEPEVAEPGVPEPAIREAIARPGSGVKDVRRHRATHYAA